jgi:hypothetical protein
MKEILGRIFGGVVDSGWEDAPRSKGDIAYDQAMRASDELIYRIREAGREHDAARSVMADVWSQAKNIPFMTTVYQAVQEAKTGPEIVRETRFIPIKINGRGHRTS